MDTVARREPYPRAVGHRAATTTLLVVVAAALLTSLVVSGPSVIPSATGERADQGSTADAAVDAPPPSGEDRARGRVETLLLDPRPMTGFSSSPAMAGDGTLWVGYLDDARGQVVVASCPDVACATVTRTDLGVVGRFGVGLDLVLDVDGPVVSHLESTGTGAYGVVVTRCLDACYASQRTVVDIGLTRVTDTAIALDADGRPLVAYRGADGTLQLARCTDPLCSSATTTSLSDGAVDGEVALAVAPSGDAVVLARDAASERLRITWCLDPVCGARETAVVGGAGGGIDPDVILDGDVAVVAHKAADGLELLRCGRTCGEGRILAGGFEAGTFAAVALDDGVPVVAYYDETERAPMVHRCSDATCVHGTTAVVDDRRVGGEHLGLAIGRDGDPVLTYRDWSGDVLRLTRCATPTCGTAQPLSAPSAVEVVGTSEGTLAVFTTPQAGLGAVLCPGGDCTSAVTLALDAGGSPPEELVVARAPGDELWLATRPADTDEAVVRSCVGDCSGTDGVVLAGVRRLLGLHAVGVAVEVLHIDADGAIAVARCDAEACGRTRLLGVPRAHATVAVSTGARTAVAWRDPVSADVWLVRCDARCDGAPTVVGRWDGAGDLRLHASDDALALAVERPLDGRTDLLVCEATCRRLVDVPGRPLTVLATDGLVHLLARGPGVTTLWTCNGGCTSTPTRLDAELMLPTIVSSDPLQVIGRDAGTLRVVTRTCDRDRCRSQGLDDGPGPLGAD